MTVKKSLLLFICSMELGVGTLSYFSVFFLMRNKAIKLSFSEASVKFINAIGRSVFHPPWMYSYRKHTSMLSSSFLTNKNQKASRFVVRLLLCQMFCSAQITH